MLQKKDQASQAAAAGKQLANRALAQTMRHQGSEDDLTFHRIYQVKGEERRSG
jgi:hypothetical protein